jgi:hypothetical protein
MITYKSLFQQIIKYFAQLKTVSIGFQSNTIGSDDQRIIAIGNYAGYQATGNHQVAIGEFSLLKSTGWCNVALGKYAGAYNTIGKQNTYLGVKAGMSGNYARNNVAIGFESLRYNVMGDSNVAIGMLALHKNINAFNNVAIGTNAFGTAQYGSYNVGIGQGAGSWKTSGHFNTLLGAWAQTSTQSANYEIVLGNYNSNVLRCAVTSLTSLSDIRDKTEIKDLEYGLDFIESLKPKQFTWNQRDVFEISEVDGEPTDVIIENSNKGKKDIGFIAQEVQQVDDNVLRLVYDENPEKLELSMGKIVPILVQAIKELSEKIKVLENN